MSNLFGYISLMIVMLVLGCVIAIGVLNRSTTNKQMIHVALAILLTFPTTAYFGAILWVNPPSRTTPLILVPWLISLLVLFVIGWKVWHKSRKR